MKGRQLRFPFMELLYASSVPMSTAQVDGYCKSKLLSARGCDSIVYTEGERETSKSLTSAEVAFYQSLPEWNEATL